MSVEVRTDMRLACRLEGQFLNVYLAPLKTMVGAQLVGMIDIKYMPEEIDFYTYLACLKGLLNKRGFKFTNTPHDAPEHERTKPV